MGATQSSLTQNNSNFPLPFFCGDYLIVSGIIFINVCLLIITGSPR